MAVGDWNEDHTLNDVIEGEDIAEGMLPAALNDTLRKMAAAIKTFWLSAYRKNATVKSQATGGALPGTAAEDDILIEYTP